MSYQITPKCPVCGSTIKINVHKVDKLIAENNRLLAEIYQLKTTGNIFSSIFKSEK